LEKEKLLMKKGKRKKLMGWKKPSDVGFKPIKQSLGGKEFGGRESHTGGGARGQPTLRSPKCGKGGGRGGGDWGTIGGRPKGCKLEGGRVLIRRLNKGALWTRRERVAGEDGGKDRNQCQKAIREGDSKE